MSGTFGPVVHRVGGSIVGDKLLRDRGRMSLPTGTREAVAYVVATATLITLGVFFRSYVLNWIVGPAMVVVIVVAFDRVTARRSRGSP